VVVQAEGVQGVGVAAARIRGVIVIVYQQDGWNITGGKGEWGAVTAVATEVTAPDTPVVGGEQVQRCTHGVSVAGDGGGVNEVGEGQVGGDLEFIAGGIGYGCPVQVGGEGSAGSPIGRGD